MSDPVHWSKVRVFNIPIQKEMLLPSGFNRDLVCNLKAESPRTEGTSQLRTVNFDDDYVVYKIYQTLKPLLICLPTVEVVELLYKALTYHP